ncbi:hypothetical protein [Sphaerotilus sp.]|uniref:hypothetical protein n=1 Tax=Sphaerotilus sp. TaxID=2093942 RepID=UPI00286E356F|nr:hypothetical protein [Sphaerotilus sp.]
MKCAIDGGKLNVFSKYVFASKDFKNIYRGRYIYKCSLCGLKQIDRTQLDETKLSDYYRSAYRNVAKIGRADTQAQIDKYRARANAIADLIPPEITVKKVFELGSGHGFNLSEIKNRFPECRLFTDEPDGTVMPGVAISKSERLCCITQPRLSFP